MNARTLVDQITSFMQLEENVMTQRTCYSVNVQIYQVYSKKDLDH